MCVAVCYTHILMVNGEIERMVLLEDLGVLVVLVLGRTVAAVVIVRGNRYRALF